MINAFSEDGYIIDQNGFKDLPYRNCPSSINGCGWVAAFDLRHALGQPVTYEEVYREMCGMYPRWMPPGPTPMRVLRRYLRRYMRICETRGRGALAAAERSNAGILRYWEGREPHFAPYTRTADGRFRFFNVADGQEELWLSMDVFFEEHCRGYVRVIEGENYE